MLRGHVDFVRGGRVGLFGRESRRRNLFTLLDRAASRQGNQTYVGHSWSSYARTIGKQIRTCGTIMVSETASELRWVVG
jgi:hypothetical protein